MLPTVTHRFGPPRQTSTTSFSSDVKNSWRTIAFLSGAQFLATLFSSYHGGVIPCEATNTELLYSPSFTVFSTLFLTFDAKSLTGLLLPVYNSTLITAFLGWPRIQDIRTSYKEVITHMVSISGVIGLRMLLGYLFGRGTGFAFPILFFNDAIHETTCGLSVIILYCITRRLYNDAGSQNSRLSSLAFLFLWFPNAFRGPVFFWSFSVACVTGIQALVSLLLGKREYSPRSLRATSTAPSKWAWCLTMIRTFLMLITVFAIISYLHYVAYRYSHEVHSEEVSTLPEPVLTQFLLLSYPRRNDSTLLSSTLQSYSYGLGSRFITSVYTTVEPASHPAFGDAQTTFMATPGLKFFPDPSPASLVLPRPVIPDHLPGKQTFDLYSALSWAEHNVRDNNTRYIGIMEDDFEWCNDGWGELKALLYEVALQESPKPPTDRFCGIFVATGGSGLLVRPAIIPMLQRSLQRYAFELNPDIILQDCLRGALPECAGCKLAASRRLLFRHTGASQSTYRGRQYPEDRWQCGWRQPFNGKLGVWVP